MTFNYKFLVKINGNKYSVIIDENISKNDSKITFNKIYKKIQQIDDKLNISFDSHLFEVLDKDFDEYVVITDDNQLIKNLSRFRVSEKKNKIETKVKSEKKFEPNKVVNNGKKSNDTNTGPRNDGLNESLEELNQDLLKNIHIPKLSGPEMKEFEDIILMISLNMRFFKERPEKLWNWTRIAHRMKDKGYNCHKFKAQYCKDLFFSYADIYRQLLEYSPNAKSAVELFPLFKNFQTLNLKFFYPEKEYNRIELLKKKLSLKPNVSQTIKSTDSHFNCDQKSKPQTISNPNKNVVKKPKESEFKAKKSMNQIMDDINKRTAQVLKTNSKTKNYVSFDFMKDRPLPEFLPISQQKPNHKRADKDHTVSHCDKKVKVEVIDLD